MCDVAAACLVMRTSAVKSPRLPPLGLMHLGISGLCTVIATESFSVTDIVFLCEDTCVLLELDPLGVVGRPPVGWLLAWLWEADAKWLAA